MPLRGVNVLPARRPWLFALFFCSRDQNLQANQPLNSSGLGANCKQSTRVETITGGSLSVGVCGDPLGFSVFYQRMRRSQVRFNTYKSCCGYPNRGSTIKQPMHADDNPDLQMQFSQKKPHRSVHHGSVTHDQLLHNSCP
ncbi:hypothetical protein C8R47DRAFT_804886 [Mycena vitilis]|nr:hypothetical protein C8R47DRAFT_804886 [Mycena vitilis]